MSSFTFPPPNEKQALFLTDTHKYIGFGGARGGGKSWAVRVKAVLLCLNYPGIKVMIIRRTYPELQENHIIPLCEMLHCHAEDKTQRVASYNDSKSILHSPTAAASFSATVTTRRTRSVFRAPRSTCCSSTRPPTRARRKWTN